MGSCRLTYTVKMRFLILGVFVCLAAVAYARPQEETAVDASNAEVVAQEEPAVEVQEGRAKPMNDAKKAKKAGKKDNKKKRKKDDKKARKGNKKDNKGNKKNDNNQRRKKNNKNNKKNKNN